MDDSLQSFDSDPEWDMAMPATKPKRGRGRGRSRGRGRGQASVTKEEVVNGVVEPEVGTRGRRTSTRRGRGSGTMFDFLSGPESSNSKGSSKVTKRGKGSAKPSKAVAKNAGTSKKAYVKPPRNEVVRVGDCSTSEEEDNENVPSPCDYARETIERTCSPLSSIHGNNSDSVHVGAVSSCDVSNGNDLIDSVQSNSNDLFSESSCATVIDPISNGVTEDHSNVIAVLPEREEEHKEVLSSEPTSGPSCITPPKPVLKKKSTKRGLAKKASDTSISISSKASEGAASGHQLYSRPVDLKSFYARKTSTEEISDQEAATPTYSLAPSSKYGSALTISSTLSTESRQIDDDLDSLDRSDDDLNLSQATPTSSKKGNYARAKVVSKSRRREPTPPPELCSDNPAKKTKLNKQLTQAFNSLVNAQSTLGSMVTPSPPFRPGRGKRHNKKLTHPLSDVMVDEDSPRRVDMPVKIRYLSKIHRIEMKLVEPFHTLVHQLSITLGEAEHQLNLCLRDQPLGLKATPQEVNLTVADIIDCYCIRPSTSENGEADPTDSINLFIQCSNKRTKVPMKFNKRRPLSDLLQQYATQMGLQVDTLSLQFDGDQVQAGDTCTTLDMDEGDVLDVTSLAGGS